MNSTFNVVEFTNLIENIISTTNRADVTLKKLSSKIEEMKDYIDSQENGYLYQGWNSVRVEIDNISKKYYEKKNEFLNDLVKYKNNTLAANDETYQNVKIGLDKLSKISEIMKSL